MNIKKIFVRELGLIKVGDDIKEIIRNFDKNSVEIFNHNGEIREINMDYVISITWSS